MPGLNSGSQGRLRWAVRMDGHKRSCKEKTPIVKQLVVWQIPYFTYLISFEQVSKMPPNALRLFPTKKPHSFPPGIAISTSWPCSQTPSKIMNKRERGVYLLRLRLSSQLTSSISYSTSLTSSTNSSS